MPTKTESKVSETISAFDRHDKEALTLPPASFLGHQRSKTTVESSLLFSATPSLSPNRLSIFNPSRTSSRDPSPNPRGSSTVDVYDSDSQTSKKLKPGKVGKIASWFEGSSDPVEIKIVASPQKEKSEPLYLLDRENVVSHSSIASMDNLTQRPRKLDATANNSANSSRFSFFRRNTLPQATIDPDELTHMDVREALLPDGPVEVTPAAFKALQLNAETLLRRFQASYTENLGALKKITSEKNAQTDELEASQTRSEHLRSQLCEMAERVTDQETRISVLKSQLAEEFSTVRMISDDDHFPARTHHRRGRVSDVSSLDESVVDSEMSSAVSIFSAAESVRTPATSVSGSPRMKHARLHSPMVMPSQQVHNHWEATPILVERCQNCNNSSAQEAWELVEMMKLESACLKERIAELESANDSALSILGMLRP